MQVVTYQDTRGNTVDICQRCATRREHDWPRNQHGEEYCQVSHGLHYGLCQICNGCTCNHAERQAEAQRRPGRSLHTIPHELPCPVAVERQAACEARRVECERTATEQSAQREAQRRAREARCPHERWRWLSHEERECVACGRVEFVPDD